MFRWFSRLGTIGKVAVIAIILIAGTAAAVTGAAFSRNLSGSRTTAPSPGQPGAPPQSNCPADLAYTTRSPGSGSINNLQTALFIRTDCGHATKQSLPSVLPTPSGRQMAGQ